MDNFRIISCHPEPRASDRRNSQGRGRRKTNVRKKRMNRDSVPRCSAPPHGQRASVSDRREKTKQIDISPFIMFTTLLSINQRISSFEPSSFHLRLPFDDSDTFRPSAVSVSKTIEDSNSVYFAIFDNSLKYSMGNSDTDDLERLPSSPPRSRAAES